MFRLWLFIHIIWVTSSSAQLYTLRVAPLSAQIQAGDTLALEAIVTDEEGVEQDVNGYDISWALRGTPPPDANVTAPNGKRVSFTATTAHETVTVECVYTYPTQLLAVKSEAAIAISPAAAYAVHLEMDTLPADLRATTSPDTLRIADVDSAVHMYGIIRDKYENYVSLVQDASWSAQGEDVVSLTSPVERQGEARIVGIDTGVCTVTVASAGLLGDTVTVVVGQQSTSTVARRLVGQALSVRGQRLGSVYDLSGRQVNIAPSCVQAGYRIFRTSSQTAGTVMTPGRELHAVR